MNLFNRQITHSHIHKKIAGIFFISFFIFKWCKKPVSVLKAYFTRKGLEYIELRNGFKLYMSSSKHDISTFVVIFCKREYGTWKDKKTVIDVGANIGIFSMYAFCCGAEKVYAFEPNKESFLTIKKSISANKLENKWFVENAGISGNSGEIIYIPKKSSPGNVAQKSARMNDEFYDAVTTISLDDYIIKNKLENIDLLKVDCEGGEYELLPSLTAKSISAIKQIKLEFHGNEIPIREWFITNNFTVTKYWLSPEEKNLGYLWAENHRY